VQISHPDAGLRQIPKFNSKSYYQRELGSVWKVLEYKHGWVRVNGPLKKELSSASKECKDEKINCSKKNLTK